MQLKKGEVLIYSENGDFGDKVEILGYEHKAVEIKEFPKVALSGSWSYRCGIVTDSRHSMESMLTAYQKLVNREGYINGGVYINLDGTDDEKTAFYNEFRDRAQTETGDGGALDSGFLIFESRQADSSGYSVYGAFLFLGLFLGLVFIFATVMIIYYKQVSEGYDDRKRFDIMQKVGMTETEVKQTIRSQVLIVFFLPLAAAAMHVAFAFPMIRRILAAFSMTNVTLFAVCTAATFAGFAIFYLLVYLQTSGTYYSIVRR